MSQKKHKFLFAAGGTGGHLFVAQALARDLKKLQPKTEIFFAGKRLGSSPFFDREAYPFAEIDSGPLSLKGSIQSIKGVCQSCKLITRYQPDQIIGFGSYYSAPILSGALIKKVPYVLVESNALTGRVNRLLSKKAQYCALQFAEAASSLKGKHFAVQMPIWADQKLQDKPLAKEHLGLDRSKFTILALGGSSGAKAINQALILLKLSIPFQIIHLCGKDQDSQKLANSYWQRGIDAIVWPFANHMGSLFAAADLAICRAGGGTISELVAYQVPSILIPWPKAMENHQLINAKSLARSKGALYLEEKNLCFLSEYVEKAIGQIESMKEALLQNGQKAKEPLAQLILSKLQKEV